MTETQTLTLGGVKATLTTPNEFTGLAIAGSVGEDATAVQRIAAGCAAVLACWPAKVRWPGNVRPKVDDFDVLGSGRMAFLSLRNAGIPMEQIGEAIAAAWPVLSSAIIGQDEVNRAAGNSEAPAEGSAG